MMFSAFASSWIELIGFLGPHTRVRKAKVLRAVDFCIDCSDNLEAVAFEKSGTGQVSMYLSYFKLLFSHKIISIDNI